MLNMGRVLMDSVSVSRLFNTVQIAVEHLFDLTLPPFPPFPPFPPCDWFWLSGGLISGGGSNFIFPMCLRFTRADSGERHDLASNVLVAELLSVLRHWAIFSNPSDQGGLQHVTQLHTWLEIWRNSPVEKGNFLSWLVNDWWGQTLHSVTPCTWWMHNNEKPHD